MERVSAEPPDPRPRNAALALGANLGDRESAIRFALDRLDAAPGVALVAAGPVIETPAVGPGAQPHYLNTAGVVRTTLDARDLLDLCLMIEQEAGRDRASEIRWGARVLDIDLLLFHDLVVDQPGLTVPHPRLHERLFVLGPLTQIAGDWRHPTLGLTIDELFHAAENAERSASRRVQDRNRDRCQCGGA